MQIIHGKQPDFNEAHFAMVFASNDAVKSKPQRIETRIYADGTRTGTARHNELPVRIKSEVVR